MQITKNDLCIKKKVRWRYTWCVMRDSDVVYEIVLCYTSLRSWRDFARECFSFGCEAVNGSGEAVGGLVRTCLRFDWGRGGNEKHFMIVYKGVLSVFTQQFSLVVWLSRVPKRAQKILVSSDILGSFG